MANIRFKVHTQGEDSVLAAADEDALGIKHKGERLVLDLISFRAFYDGESASEEKLALLLATCTSANLVGEASVGAAIRAGHAARENVIKVGKVPHLQIYKMEKQV